MTQRRRFPPKYGKVKTPTYAGISYYQRDTWDHLIFKNPVFIAFILDQIGDIPDESDPEFALYQAAKNGFDKPTQGVLKRLFLGKDKRFLPKILHCTHGIYSLEAKFGQTENGKVEEYLEYKIDFDCPYAKYVLREKIRYRMYKVIWDYYVNFEHTALPRTNQAVREDREAREARAQMPPPRQKNEKNSIS